MLNLIARHYVISGRVQGVGFRYFAERAAREAVVTGWVRNLADGSVEVHANGNRVQMELFESKLRMGPPRSEIRGFESSEASPTQTKSFEIR
jgi:acylphosphatase